MPRVFSNEEYTDIHFVYGFCGGNARKYDVNTHEIDIILNILTYAPAVYPLNPETPCILSLLIKHDVISLELLYSINNCNCKTMEHIFAQDIETDVTEFTPRSYQIDLYEKAVQNNTILYLPTSAGKTYIAVMLLKHLSADVRKPYKEDGKRSIFVVNKELVIQQTEHISRHTGLNCKGYSRNLQNKSCKKKWIKKWMKKWMIEIETYQVLVMTSEIFLDLLSYECIKLNKVNLIVFDECHIAVSNHPMRQIMQKFKDCPKEKQPRVLAMSTALFNANINLDELKNTIKALEITFRAKIATIESTDCIQEYFTNSKKNIIKYEECHVPEVIAQIDPIIDQCVKMLENIKLSFDETYKQSSAPMQPETESSKLIAIIENIKATALQIGIYGGSKSASLHLIQLESLKKYFDNSKVESLLLDYLITQIILIRKMFDNEMEGYTELQQLYKFTSDQIHKMFETLIEHKNKLSSKKKFHCIIFVKERFMTQVIYHILKILSAQDERYSFLSLDYITKFQHSPHKCSREVSCITKWNKDVWQRFKSGSSNCVVVTDVDEDIDVPACNLIIQYDVLIDFGRYIQSNGRACNNASHYTILMPNNDFSLREYQHYKNSESYLKQILVGESELRTLPTDSDIVNYTDFEIKPYVVERNGIIESCITEESAINVINMYCQNLLRSKFVHLVPVWQLYQKNLPDGMILYQISLKLPNISPYLNIWKHTEIRGDFMTSIDSAKRSAAMKSCIQLYKQGALTDKLLPVTADDIVQNMNYLYPNWIDEDNYFGTYKKERHHKLEYPTALYGAFPQPLEQLHLHVINCTSTYFPTSDNRRAVFYNLLNDESSFGILSTKSMPKIPSFPIFMKDGKSDVDVKTDYEMLILSKNDIESLKRFHFLLFNEIISDTIVKSFMLFDNENLENSFLIVPLNDKKEINWDIVRTYQSLELIMPSKPFHFKTSDYELALVSPNYSRALSFVYIVTRVCDDLTPESCFPDEDFEKFTHYYKEKYGLTIENLEQSLLDVKLIPTEINYTIPRKLPNGPVPYLSADDTVEDFQEYFIPELCYRINFPAIYWIKATTLPSILHRVSQLLNTEDLRVTIAKEIELGPLTLNEWSPLKLEEEIEILKKKDSSKRLDLTVDDTIINTIQFLNVFELSDCNSYLTDREPQDIYRNMEEIQKIDIQYYSQFMSKKNNVDENDNVQENTKENVGRYITRSTVSTPSLEVLVPSEKISWDSNLIEIVHALTTKVAADMFNLERLATLGDSYLKFITSLFLYHEFRMFSEVPLTALKNKMIGNRNLYYCGNKKGIPGRIKNDAFNTTCFIPPAHTVPRPLQRKLLDESVDPNELNEFIISKEEKFTGQINEKTRNMMQQIVLKLNKRNESKNDFEHYLGVQILSDKTVADSVKALIGVYLKSNGIRDAAKLLEWFGILPLRYKYVQIDKLLNVNPPDPIIGNGDPNHYMPWADAAEIKFGYKFKNRAHLLQAFTHPSYTANGITECYQRLEFLGDAILDFLITCYIYENCGNLSPDDLTDLRSALVNNITFACLAVRYGLHTALFAYAPKLHKAIDRFVKYHEERNYVINNELLYMLLEEEECNLAEDVDVPITLGDLFKSLIGAIYLDSGKNLTKTWEIVYSFMHKEIGEFSKNVPKQPVQLIYKNTDAHPKFLDAIRIEGTNTIMVPLKVTIAGKEKLFHGFGLNKKQATCSASKQALKRLHLEK